MPTKSEIRNLVEPHILNALPDQNFRIVSRKASELLTSNRFDLAFKLIYLEMADKDAEVAKLAYKEHIRAFTLGSFIEHGQQRKNSISKYYASFARTFNELRKGGFDPGKSLVPLARNGSIANGAHRISSAIFLGKAVECIELPIREHAYDYKYFSSRHVSAELLDFAACKFIEYSESAYVAIVWPAAFGRGKTVEGEIPNVIYQKTILLNRNGARNLVQQMFPGEQSSGCGEIESAVASNKIAQCFKSSGPLRVLAYHANCSREVVEIESRIRSIFGEGDHAVYITSSKDEAVRAAQLLFNENGIHFLNNAKPYTFASTHNTLRQFEEHLDKNGLSKECAVLDDGMVLALYGLRESSDMALVVSAPEPSLGDKSGVEARRDWLPHHGRGRSSLVFDPRYHFYFSGIKFVAFHQVYAMKKIRSDDNDIVDFGRMKPMVERVWLRKFRVAVSRRLFYAKASLRPSMIITRVLSHAGLYDTVKGWYFYFKRRQ